ncbi:hypothetical protein BHM03_00038719 [Ensete ventricosum]|nr:hypothetical protein BHM03_00038719 [Ensete ventricosum]
MRTQRDTTVLFQISLLRLRRLDSNRRVELGGRSGNPIGQKKAGDGVRWRTPWETPNLSPELVPAWWVGVGEGEGEAPGKAHHRKECEEAIISPAALFLQPRKSFRTLSRRNGGGRCFLHGEGTACFGGGRRRTISDCYTLENGLGTRLGEDDSRTEFKTI